MRRSLLLLVAGLAAAAAASAGTPRFNGTVLSPPVRAPDFSLRDQGGHAVRLSSLRGKVVLVTFLYTHCPDVCPLIASHLNDALRQLGKRAAGVRVIAISIDPKRDTHTSVTRFVRTHGLLAQFRYLTGTQAQLARVWKAWKIAVFPGQNGTVAHASYVFLVDRTGLERLLYDSTVTGAQVVHDLALLR